MKNLSKTYLLLGSIFFLISANAQEELDADFLKSLPSDIRGDLLSEMNQNAQNEKDKKYNSFDTNLSKTQQQLKEIQLKLQKIENNFADTSKQSSDLKRFGDHFFQSMQSSFSPTNQPSASSNYILDVGDILRVQIIGKVNSSSSLQVYKDGSISIPGIGKIYVAGLSIARVDDLIAAEANNTYIGSKIFTTLTSMRDINILITGNASMPGIYTLNGGSSVISALDSAGGIDLLGSYRNIHHYRNNKLIQVVDLYDIFYDGKLGESTSLRSGDSLIIKPAQSTIYLSGGVINEAVYEFKEGEYLSDIINFAGGFISSFNNIIRIDRTTKDGVQSLEVPLKSITETQLSNFDNIMVQSYAPVRESIQSVKLTGEVMNPGDYNIKTGETLSQLINRAGGYTDNAQEYRGVFNRAEAYEVSKTSNQRNYSQMIKFIATSPAARDMIAAGETSLAFILQEYRNLEPSGRIIAEFDLSKIRNDPSLDITLVASDEIHIPKITQMVYITGELLSPGALPYKPEYNFKDYIEVTGGYSEFSDNQRVIVINPNGSARLVRNKLFNFESRDSILPGSVIYVPREIGKIEGLNYAAVLAPVFSSLALSVASLNAID